MNELLAAIDEACDLGAILLGPLGNGFEVGLVGLTQVGGIGARDRALLAHPGNRDRRVEASGECDADALAEWK